jgi:hypothetical protein
MDGGRMGEWDRRGKEVASSENPAHDPDMEAFTVAFVPKYEKLYPNRSE